MVAVVTVNDKEVKIISNGMVDIQKYVGFDARPSAASTSACVIVCSLRSWNPPRMKRS